MMKFLRKIIFLLSKNKMVYRVARRLAWDHDGENNGDILTNGEMAFLRRHLKNCAIVFDVGANIGEWTQMALSLNPDVEIHCFEPSKNTFSELEKNNFPANIFRNNFGLGSEKADKEFYIFGESSAMNSLYPREGPNFSIQNKETVRIDTIDNYCAANRIEEIDFLKIDAEGHDFEVLKGASKMLKDGKIKIIQFEYGGTYIDAGIFLKDIFKFFEELNYRIFKIFPGSIKRIEKYNSALDNFQYANYLIINADYINKFF